ncbi:MAG: hypothetical protein MUD14_22765 [Hydrococcus sp. Prado102]|jgi:hypothetical protein|nr:hypothetical protein [Hydrococcus sp. Prado102]
MNQWQLYKQLELIPDSIPKQPTKQPVLTLPLQLAWKVFIDALANELVYEQQVEYLERCLAQSQSESYLTRKTWRKLWSLME